MARVVHFEIHTDDPERAIKFYNSVFDWEIKKWDGPIDYWLVMTGSTDEPGIDGGISKRQIPSSGEGINSYVCTVDIDDIDKYIEKVEKNGGAIAVPKTEIPNVGIIVYCKDTEGNLFGMMQSAMEQT